MINWIAKILNKKYKEELENDEIDRFFAIEEKIDEESSLSPKKILPHNSGSTSKDDKSFPKFLSSSGVTFMSEDDKKEEEKENPKEWSSGNFSIKEEKKEEFQNPYGLPLQQCSNKAVVRKNGVSGTSGPSRYCGPSGTSGQYGRISGGRSVCSISPMSFSEYIAENLDKNIDCSQYIADNLDKNISYTEYTAENGALTTKATSIVNADVNASAAIAYTKLALANSILNSDINPAAPQLIQEAKYLAKKEESKRIYSPEDPYGEEDWNE